MSHEKVLLVLDGKAAGDAMQKKGAPVDAAIVGIIDHVESRMTEDELRALVREVIASRAAPHARPSVRRVRPQATPGCDGRAHRQPGSPCVIEPHVGCNQCGYCVSMGH